MVLEKIDKRVEGILKFVKDDVSFLKVISFVLGAITPGLGYLMIFHQNWIFEFDVLKIFLLSITLSSPFILIGLFGMTKDRISKFVRKPEKGFISSALIWSFINFILVTAAFFALNFIGKGIAGTDEFSIWFTDLYDKPICFWVIVGILFLYNTFFAASIIKGDENATNNRTHKPTIKNNNTQKTSPWPKEGR